MTIRLRSLLLGFVFAVLGCWSPLVHGQSVGGTIVGLVTDSSGRVIPQAQVTALNLQTGVERTISTNRDGAYSIPFLNPGFYSLQVSAPGFEKFIQGEVQITVASTARVNAVLKVGSVSQVVSVSGQGPILQTDSSDVAYTIDSRQLQQLPTEDRSYQDLVSLLPGTGQPQQSATDIGPEQTKLTAVNGQSAQANNYEIDGLDNNDVILGNTFQVPPIESIQEVHVVTSNYDAEAGRAGGAEVSVQTQSGTNNFHGSAFGFHRDSFLEARRSQPQEARPLKDVYNLFGGTSGGPIIKDKTFFFADFQGITDRQNVAELLSVPVAAFRNGDFSSVLGTPLGLTDPAGNMIYSGSLFDPNSGNPDGTGRLVFPGNIIPPSRFSPQANAINALLPVPNLSGLSNNYLIQVPIPEDIFAFDVRADHKLSDVTSIFGKYNYRHVWTDNFSSAGAALRPDGFLNGLGHLQAQTGSFNLTRAFGNTLVGEGRFGINRFHYDYTGVNQTTAGAIGIGGLATTTELPQINFYDGSFTNIGFNPYYPLVNNQTTYQGSSTWTKVAGKHRIKWGADFRHLNLLRDSRSSNTGTFFFYNDVTRGMDDAYVNQLVTTPGSTFSAFLLGLPDQVQRNQLIHPPQDLANNLFAYGQDSWSVSRKLVLNLGLRWEYYAPITAPEQAGAANYDVNNGDLLIAGLGVVSNAAGVKSQFRNFAPRIGFAYTVTPKTVLRGGYGISYTVHPDGGYGALLSTNFPNVSTNQIGIIGSGFPGGSLSTMIPVTYPALPSNGIFSPAPQNQIYYALAPNTPFPNVQSFSLTLEQELSQDLTLSIAYVGNKGTHLFDNYHEVNYSPPGSGNDGGQLYKEFGFQGSVQEVGFDLNSAYSSLQVNLTKRFAHGITGTAAYTWQQALGDVYGFPPDALKMSWGTQSNKNQFVTAHVVELPFGRGRAWLQDGIASQILGGWQYNGVLSTYSGTPFSVLSSPSLLNGVRLARNPAQLVGTPTILGGTGPGLSWFNTAAYTDPPVGQYGNAGNQSLYGPGYFNYNVSLFRTFTVGNEGKLEFRIESFNVTNTPHWGTPLSNVDQAAFGQILTDNNDPRKFQFAGRFTY